MKDKPILFSGPMVRAILEGRKTQTRRVMKVQPPDDSYRFATLADTTASDRRKVIGQHHWMKLDGFKEVGSSAFFKSPFGYVGQKLWVRESWRTYNTLDYLAPSQIQPGAGIQYEAGGTSVRGYETLYDMGKLRPSLFMPRWASRLTLEVTGVRVERLQDISEEDIRSEGLVYPPAWIGVDGEGQPIEHEHIDKDPWFFWKHLWESINGSESWDSNPWVWVVEFKKI